MLSSFTALQILPFMHQPLLHHYLCIKWLSSVKAQKIAKLSLSLARVKIYTEQEKPEQISDTIG